MQTCIDIIYLLYLSYNLAFLLNQSQVSNLAAATLLEKVDAMLPRSNSDGDNTIREDPITIESADDVGDGTSLNEDEGGDDVDPAVIADEDSLSATSPPLPDGSLPRESQGDHISPQLGCVEESAFGQAAAVALRESFASVEADALNSYGRERAGSTATVVLLARVRGARAFQVSSYLYF